MRLSSFVICGRGFQKYFWKATLEEFPSFIALSTTHLRYPIMIFSDSKSDAATYHHQSLSPGNPSYLLTLDCHMVPSFGTVSSPYCINSMFYWGIIGGNLHFQWLNHAKAKSKFLGLFYWYLAKNGGLVTRMTGKKKCHFFVLRSCSTKIVTKSMSPFHRGSKPERRHRAASAETHS